MKRYYPNNPSHEKAAIILASMSPDMVRDIVDLVNTRGLGVVDDVTNDPQTMRPYAIFSRSYIPDDAFPHVFLGMSAIFTASLRELTQDFDFYEKVLSKAFYIPSTIASQMAKNIETQDIIGGARAAKDAGSWYTAAGNKLMELTRQAANWTMSVLHLPFENDQSQNYDIDFLYEVKLLGQAVDQLNMRAELAKGQATAAGALGLFNPGSKIYGDVSDDMIGDPVDAYEVMLLEALKPEMGNPLPKMIFGGLSKLVGSGKKSNGGVLRTLLEKAGLVKGANPVDPAAQEAAKRIITNNPGAIASMANSGSKEQLAQAISLLQQVQSSGALGDVAEMVADNYGEPAARSWASGNIPGLMNDVINEAGDAILSTGDTSLDETVIGDVLSETDNEFGDTEGALDSEMGGLFKRARINRKIKQAARRTRRTKRRESKQARKNREEAQLIAARDAAADAQVMREERIPTVDDYLSEIRASQTANQYAPAYNDMDVQGSQYTMDGTTPDDVYNPNAGNDFFFEGVPNP